MVVLQPCDWQESDIGFKNYAVEVFGRTKEDDVVKVRLTDFCPYFYIKHDESYSINGLIKKLEDKVNESNKQFKNARDVKLYGIKITIELKLDAMNGFGGLVPIKVWKVTCPTLRMFKSVGKAAEKLFTTYETDLPPYIRMFHELDINPASPITFEADPEDVPDDVVVDACYTVSYTDVKSVPTENVPLYLLSYDIEVYSESGQFPVAQNAGDEITEIGMSFRYSDDMLNSYRRIVLINGTASESEDPSVEFISCRNEKDLLMRFDKLIRDENPDAICGYNTFGFDDSYIADRADKLNVEMRLGRIDPNSWKSSRDRVETIKKKFELASGTFAVRYFDMPGRLPIDLLLSVRREQNLDSYKLDNVASTFLRDKVTNVVELTGTETQMYEIHTKNTRGLFVGNLVRFDIVTNTINPYRDGSKFKVIEVHPKKFIVELPHAHYLFDDLSTDELKKLEWSFTKDDTSFKDMLEAHRGTPEQRARIAKYCVQDCDLVLTLMAKLDTLVNARGMADVCFVPIQYIFLRGQGIKIYSAVVYNASKRNQIIMTQEGFEGDTSYEGAIVLPPKIGMYLNQPVPVLDFNSLYPSNMIAYNLSPDTLLYVKRYDENGSKQWQRGPDGKDFTERGYTVDEIKYDVHDESGNGRMVCGFIQPKTDDPRTVGLLPLTLDILLKKRKETRKRMETTEDDAQKSVLNGLQLAYKVVANSVYGQCGSKTSPIRSLEVAASTTAAGRDRIQDAKRIVETEFGGQVIYGDTDSIFIKFQTTNLEESMKLGQQAAERITSWIDRKPYKIEYEKTFYPFILFCRKRYVGMMYEDDPTKCKRKSMGIALKRRDNAPIVKDVFGGALDILMEKRDIKTAQKFVQDMLVQVMQNKIPLEKYVVTKQLRDDYITEVPTEIKNHQSKGKPSELNMSKASYILIKRYAMEHDLELPKSSIAHRTLADRMEERDPGNKPQVGDRIPYIYVAARRDEKKQGDRIEHYDYVKEKNLKPDVEFYITNQIQNPVAQMFALAVDQLDGYKSRTNYATMLTQYMEDGKDEEDATLAVLKQKEKELESILFLGAQYLSKHKRGPMDAFLGRK
jgi:DNA polymerase elongation subunit (family B)